MARIDWNMFKEKTESTQTTNTGSSNTSRVGYFSLKNDGDEAVVRFMHDTPDDFDLLVVHRMQQADGRYKSVSCLRNPNDPIDMCPICAEGGKPEYKIYIHLLEYVRQEDGSVKPLPKVWERSASYAKRLSNLMNEYGPLSDCLFKIKRQGASGSLTTGYDIMYASDKVYPSNVYVKDTKLFDGYTALGHAVLDKSYEELANFDAAPENGLSTPRTNKVEAPAYSAPATQAVPTYDRPTRTYDAPTQTQPSENTARPRRYY